MQSPSPKSLICVVGVGAQTAVGLTGPSSAAAVRSGIPGFGEHPFMIDRQGEPMIVAKVPGLENNGSGLDRYVSLALPAAREALQPLESARGQAAQLRSFVGLPPQRPGRPDGLDNHLTQALSAAYGVTSVECIAAGHASGLMALEKAGRHVLAHDCDFCLVGGVDSYLDPNTLEWLERNSQLHGGDNAYGFIPGEGAGFCLLCSQALAEKWKLRVLARVWTVATSRENNLIKTESVCLGSGLTEVFRKVFTQLPSPDDRIGYTICDMNGEPYRADEYGFTISRLSPKFQNASEFLAPADCWGDVGAASGPLFVNLVAAASLRGYASARHNLVWASSETGERSAAILQNAN